jgi:hypothetical protein
MESPFVLPRDGDRFYNGNGDLSGAQTERRGGAGPVRGLLGGKASPAAFFFSPVGRHYSKTD